MKQVFRKLLLVVFSVAVALCAAFLLTEGLRQTGWYKERLYHLLLTGDKQQKLRAASTLAEVGAEAQLLRALKAEDSATHEMARRAVEHLWFFAAGREAYEQIQAAYRAEEREDYKQALQILDRLLGRHPDFAEAWNRRASVFWQTGDYERSMGDCERTLKLNPNHYGALQGKGVCLLKKGELAEACRALRAALRISPHDVTTRQCLEQCEQLLRSLSPDEKPGKRSDLI